MPCNGRTPREGERENSKKKKEKQPSLKPCNRLCKKGVGIVSIPSEGCNFSKEKENRTDAQETLLSINPSLFGEALCSSFVRGESAPP
jgi:hypothetical protein